MQVRSILGQVRPGRQTLLFSATLPAKVDRLVRDALTSPVRITVGPGNAANEDIKQVPLCLAGAPFVASSGPPAASLRWVCCCPSSPSIRAHIWSQMQAGSALNSAMQAACSWLCLACLLRATLSTPLIVASDVGGVTSPSAFSA